VNWSLAGGVIGSASGADHGLVNLDRGSETGVTLRHSYDSFLCASNPARPAAIC
jgi:hypothetical protein